MCALAVDSVIVFLSDSQGLLYGHNVTNVEGGGNAVRNSLHIVLTCTYVPAAGLCYE